LSGLRAGRPPFPPPPGPGRFLALISARGSVISDIANSQIIFVNGRMIDEQ
jgi:hypothetical protein